MNRGLQDSQSDEDHLSGAEHDAAAEAINAAGLDSDNEGELGLPTSETAGFASEDEPNDLKALGLDGSDDEFHDVAGLEDDVQEQQPVASHGPRPVLPDRNYGPPAVRLIGTLHAEYYSAKIVLHE